MKQETKHKIKGIMLDVEANEAKVVEFEPTLENYYSMLHCDMIEYATRRIGSLVNRRTFSIVCDEEGTFKNDPKISGVDFFGNTMFVGNIMIVGSPNSEGEDTSLSDDDIKFIMCYIYSLPTRNHPLGYRMLTHCEY